MPAADFIQELRDLGYQVDDSPNPQLEGNVVVRFPFQIPLGTKAGDEITLAFNEPPDGGVSDASGTFGADWQYWSRPYNGWAQGDRNVRAYMRHIKHLFHLI